MFVIDKHNKILLTKGDSASIKIEVVTCDDKPYIIKPTDVIVMTVKRSAEAAAAITKVANSTHNITFTPTDTNHLTPGLYLYDIQLTDENNQVFTIVPTSFFELCEEIS